MTTFTYQNLAANGHGRLGNQLWQIAWMIGQAQGNPENLYVDPNWAYRPYFSLPEEAYEMGPGPIVDGGSGFYQELQHWAGYEQQVWEWFQPSDEAYDYLYRTYPRWLFNSGASKCSIHHRRGDYLTNPQMFPQPTNWYYETAINRVLEEKELVEFVVFSDDYQWIRNKYTGENFYCVEGREQAVDPARRDSKPSDQWDLFLMSQCCVDHIVANSSFSWWGAYLSPNDKAYYPSVWWGPQLNSVDSTGRRSVDTWREGIPATWKEIQC